MLFVTGRKKRRTGHVMRDTTSEEASEEDGEEEDGLLSPAGSVTELRAAVQSSNRIAKPGKNKKAD